jgi:hypothetical protein
MSHGVILAFIALALPFWIQTSAYFEGVWVGLYLSNAAYDGSFVECNYSRLPVGSNKPLRLSFAVCVQC